MFAYLPGPLTVRWGWLLFLMLEGFLLGTRAVAAGATRVPAWGRIANHEHRGERILSALFFAGPLNPGSLPLYTHHPLHQDKQGRDGGMDEALRQMVSVGLNTIQLSYWGHDGEADSSAPTWLFSQTRWPGDSKPGKYTEAEQIALAHCFFTQAAAHGLLVAPLLEVGPQFPFYSDFPVKLDNLVERASWLLKNFGDEPNWLRVTDQTGRPRHVLWLIETIHDRPIDAETFAQGFGTAALRLKRQTGRDVGFILDPTPLPLYGSEAGPDPVALRGQASVLAINPFNITSQGIVYRADLRDITEDERQQYAESVLRRWAASGTPLIAPIMPGYDAHHVFPQLPIYGFSAAWRQRQKELAVRYGADGLSVDCWNGWTEGYAIPPSIEQGDVNLRWVRETVRAVKQAR